MSNFYETVYEAGSSISTWLLGPSETTEADTNAGKQTRPASPREMFPCVLRVVGSDVYFGRL